MNGFVWWWWWVGSMLLSQASSSSSLLPLPTLSIHCYWSLTRRLDDDSFPSLPLTWFLHWATWNLPSILPLLLSIAQSLFFFGFLSLMRQGRDGIIRWSPLRLSRKKCLYQFQYSLPYLSPLLSVQRNDEEEVANATVGKVGSVHFHAPKIWNNFSREQVFPFIRQLFIVSPQPKTKYYLFILTMT